MDSPVACIDIIKAVPLSVIRLQNLAFDSLIEIMIHGYYSNPGLVAEKWIVVVLVEVIVMVLCFYREL